MTWKSLLTRVEGDQEKQGVCTWLMTTPREW